MSVTWYQGFQIRILSLIFSILLIIKEFSFHFITVRSIFLMQYYYYLYSITYNTITYIYY